MKKKICSKCKDEKPISEFLFRNKKQGTYHSACRTCYSEIRKKSYNKNKKTSLDRVNKNKLKKKEWFIEYKNNLSCSKCPESHPACLDFHHINPNDKFNNVSTMVYENYSIGNILKEIKKCIVLCSNCHRKLHYVELQII